MKSVDIDEEANPTHRRKRKGKAREKVYRLEMGKIESYGDHKSFQVLLYHRKGKNGVRDYLDMNVTVFTQERQDGDWGKWEIEELDYLSEAPEFFSEYLVGIGMSNTRSLRRRVSEIIKQDDVLSKAISLAEKRREAEEKRREEEKEKESRADLLVAGITDSTQIGYLVKLTQIAKSTEIGPSWVLGHYKEKFSGYPSEEIKRQSGYRVFMLESSGREVTDSDRPGGKPYTDRTRTQATVNTGIRISKLLNRRDVLIFDTETTGLGDDAEIVELTIINTLGEVMFHSYFTPSVNIEEGAAGVHGIRQSDQLGCLLVNGQYVPAPRFTEEMGEIASVFSQSAHILAWNVKFDLRLLVQSGMGSYRGQIGQAQIWDMMQDLAGCWSKGLQENVQASNIKVPGDPHTATHDCYCVLSLMQTYPHNNAILFYTRSETKRPAKTIREPKPKRRLIEWLFWGLLVVFVMWLMA